MLNELERKVAVGHEIYYIIPENAVTPEEQIKECYQKLDKFLVINGLSKLFVVKQVFFIKNNSNAQTSAIQVITTDFSSKFFGSFVPLSIVSQSPFSKSSIAAEFTVINYPDIKHIETKEVGSVKYLSIETANYIQIIGSGLGKISEVTDIYSQSIEAFTQAENILRAENLDFSNIVRQWNYIEKIIDYTDQNQHYQIFNDVRSSFYDKCNFTNGYPSATGIGMECGGVIIDFIAIKDKTNIDIVPIKSPIQADAHQYSKEVLAHNEKAPAKKETTPKFERAKALVKKGNSCIFISGTAAIKGQMSINIDAEEQTELTLKNIFSLVTPENLLSNGIKIHFDNIFPLSFRVYIKNDVDFAKVKSVCERQINDSEILYVKADICRPELLVEIEALFSAI